MLRKDLGYTLLELSFVLLIIAVVAAFTLPSATTAVQNYRLHSDSAAIASYLNVTRMRAASQATPYALDVNPSTPRSTYVIEKLSSTAYNPLNPSSSGSYNSLSPPVYEMGTQYASDSTSISICRPASATAYPAPISADPSSCTGPFQFCFNTRGLPVLCTAVGSNPPGSPLLNGGAALYVTNQNGLVDAVTIAVGGAVQTWNWSPASAQWSLR